MEVELVRDPKLKKGAAALPEGFACPAEATLSLGGNRTTIRPVPGGRTGQIRLAPDLWAKLAVPYEGLRLQARQSESDSTALELGPVVMVLYTGHVNSVSERTAASRAEFSFGHVCTEPGLWAIGFTQSIHWDRSELSGFVVDNREGRAGTVLAARFPMPDAVRLTWSIPRDVVQQLRERTGNRTFNWVRNMGKWQFHNLIAADPMLAAHLPETRLFKNHVDLAAMLARHRTVFVKNVFGIQGMGSVRIDRAPGGFVARHIDGATQTETKTATLAELLPLIKRVAGRRAVVQQGLSLTGKEGRKLDFRVLIVRTDTGEWRSALVMAKVAPDEKLVFTNVANGATDEDALASLERHHGMSRPEAERCVGNMVSLCLAAARVLEGPLHPLGILGFDVVVEGDSQRMWLLEANTVPGFGYTEAVDAELARSQVDYARFLAGFAH